MPPDPPLSCDTPLVRCTIRVPLDENLGHQLAPGRGDSICRGRSLHASRQDLVWSSIDDDGRFHVDVMPMLVGQSRATFPIHNTLESDCEFADVSSHATR